MTIKQVRLIVFFIAVLGAMLSCGYQSALIQNGYSMEPTIVDGQKLYTEKVSLSDLKRGDIIYFQFSDTELVKRLIGLPGEKVEIRDGNIYINDEILVEEYEASSPEYIFGPIILEENQYFVLGDNRNNSKDSHEFGPVESDQILGRVSRIE